jgi:hypothetical protein
MKNPSLAVPASLAPGSLISYQEFAKKMVVGVNVVDIDKLSEPQQDARIEQLHRDG